MNWDQKFEIAKNYLRITLAGIDIQRVSINLLDSTFWLNDRGDIRGAYISKKYPEMQAELEEFKPKSKKSTPAATTMNDEPSTMNQK